MRERAFCAAGFWAAMITVLMFLGGMMGVYSGFTLIMGRAAIFALIMYIILLALFARMHGYLVWKLAFYMANLELEGRKKHD
jgi:hypothetical protein